MSSLISTARSPQTTGGKPGSQACHATGHKWAQPFADGHLQMEPIGTLISCFSEKFGTPRQPALAATAPAAIEIFPPYHLRQAWQGLEEFSHIWVVFWFHANNQRSWRPMVRPPRLGGNRKLGVFATRTGFRPNPIGISAVKLEKIEFRRRQTKLYVSGIDVVDQTPVLDIKPYLPWADGIDQAQGGFAHRRPEAVLEVEFSHQAGLECQRLEDMYPGLTHLIRRVIELDPRPAYKHTLSRTSRHGLRLYDLEISWQVCGKTARILKVTRQTSGSRIEKEESNPAIRQRGGHEA